jgi:hypothetical protein
MKLVDEKKGIDGEYPEKCMGMDLAGQLTNPWWI